MSVSKHRTTLKFFIDNNMASNEHERDRVERKRKREKEEVTNETKAQKTGAHETVAVVEELDAEGVAMKLITDVFCEQVHQADIDGATRICVFLKAAFVEHYTAFVATHPDASFEQLCELAKNGEGHVGVKNALKQGYVKRCIAKGATAIKSNGFGNEEELVEENVKEYLDAYLDAFCLCAGATKADSVRYIVKQFLYYARGQIMVERKQHAALKATLDWIQENTDTNFSLTLFVNEPPRSEFDDYGTIVQAIDDDPEVARAAAHMYFLGEVVKTEYHSRLNSDASSTDDDEECNVFK